MDESMTILLVFVGAGGVDGDDRYREVTKKDLVDRFPLLRPEGL